MKAAVILLLNLVVSLFGVASLMPVMMLPMAFDAPGSTADIQVLAFAALLLSFPFVCLGSVIASLWFLLVRRDYEVSLFLIQPPWILLCLLLLIFAIN